jgi:hypothetical protein
MISNRERYLDICEAQLIKQEQKQLTAYVLKQQQLNNHLKTTNDERQPIGKEIPRKGV